MSRSPYPRSFLQQAAAELEGGLPLPGLWQQALARADGIEGPEARKLYLDLRALSLWEESKARRLEERRPELDEAEKKMRLGAWAGFAWAAFVGAVTAFYVISGLESPLYDAWTFLDAAFLALCSVGLLYRSRVAAVMLLGLFVGGKFYVLYQLGADPGILVGLVVSLVLLLFLLRATAGAFAYHRLQREVDPDYRPARRRWVWVTAGGAGALIAPILVWGILLETNLLQILKVLEGDELRESSRSRLVAAGLIEPDENVLFFYSDSLWSILRDGNLFTDRRAISYRRTGDSLWYASAEYRTIEDIEYYLAESFWDYTEIVIYPAEEEPFVLLLDDEPEKDWRFVEELLREWRLQRALAERLSP